jgi:hypothetical protein
MDMETKEILSATGERISVSLVGRDGNAFSILAACDTAMRRAGVTKDTRDKFLHGATDGDYNHLLQTCTKYFNVS